MKIKSWILNFNAYFILAMNVTKILRIVTDITKSNLNMYCN